MQEKDDDMTNDLALVRNLDDVMSLSKTLAGAIGTGFIPKGFRNQAEIAAVILAGRELGVPPMASLRNFFLIEGKLGMDASFVLGRMLASGITHKWTIDTDERATVVLSRPGSDPYTSTFSMDDARRAGLASKAVWKSYPRAMLRARAVTTGARAYAPDVFSGSVYTAEELRGGGSDEEPAQAPAQRVTVEAVGEVVDGAVSRLAAPTPSVVETLVALEVAQTLPEIAAVYQSLQPVWGKLTNEQRATVKSTRRENEQRVRESINALAERMRTDDGGGYLGDDDAPVTGGDANGEVSDV